MLQECTKNPDAIQRALPPAAGREHKKAAMLDAVNQAY